MDDLTKRVARLVKAYVEHVWPHLERSGGTPDEPMQAAKGSSNPPVSEWVLRLMDSNRIASLYFRWALEEVEKGDVVSLRVRAGDEAIYLATPLKLARYNPGYIQTWRAGEEPRDRAMYLAFEDACRFVAQAVVFLHGRTEKECAELERRLDLEPLDPEALAVKRHPDDEAEVRGRTRRGQILDTMYTRRAMVDELEAFKERTGYKGKDAMEILAERKQREGKDWTYCKIRDALTAVNKERRGEKLELKSDRYHAFDEDGAA